MAKVEVRTNHRIGTIHPNLYGHFAEHLGRCTYEGIWVGEDSSIPNTRGIRTDVVAALRRLSPPVIRWPGGCFADAYHWQDGVGPRANRPRRMNMWWGGIETNEFGTHEFMDFCQQVGAAPYLCLNVGSGTVQEARDWMEYCNASLDTSLVRQRAANGHPGPFAVKYWGIGNENWGCGGTFTAEDYANEVCRFGTFLPGMGVPVEKIACGPSSNDADWSHRFFDTLAKRNRLQMIQGYAAHLYYGGGNDVDFSDSEYDRLLTNYLQMERLVKQQRAILDGYDPDRRIGLVVDEWAVWHPQAQLANGLEQRSTLRDALVGAAVLDVFNRHADKVVMSNVAQMMNVLQCVVFVNGADLFLTTTYHVYEMYKGHQSGTSLDIAFDSETVEVPGPSGAQKVPTLTGSASIKGKSLTISLVNLHRAKDESVKVALLGDLKVKQASARVLTGNVRDYNDFAHPNKVRPKKCEVKASAGSLHVELPAHSLVLIQAAVA